MKHLITGANGFIGRALMSRVDGIAVPREMLRHPIALKKFIEKHNPDVIVHLAAYGNHYNQTDPYQTIDVNIKYTLNLLEASKDTPYQKFINVSSSSVTLPQTTFYSASKIAGEKLCEAFGMKYNKPIYSVRPYSVYGPGEADFRFIPTVIRCLLSGEHMTVDENAVHDWIYLEDFISGLLLSKVNIGTGIQHTNKEVIEILEKISGKKLNYTPGKLRDYDNSEWKAPKQILWYISLEAGLTLTYQHYAKR